MLPRTGLSDGSDGVVDELHWVGDLYDLALQPQALGGLLRAFLHRAAAAAVGPEDFDFFYGRLTATAGSTPASGLWCSAAFRFAGHDAPTAKDDTANGFTSFRMLRQRKIVHALLDLVAFHFVAVFGRDGFVEVGHGVLCL